MAESLPKSGQAGIPIEQARDVVVRAVERELKEYFSATEVEGLMELEAQLLAQRAWQRALRELS